MAHEYEKSVARLHTRDRHGSFGSGVFISERAILTARHVAAPESTQLPPALASNATIAVESAGWFGIRESDSATFPERRDIDLALIFLNPPKSIERTYCAPVSQAPSETINVGDEVQILGFSSSDRELQVTTTRIISVDGTANAYVCDKALPKGFSGGPVFSEDTLVGIVYARHFENGHSYFHGGQILLDFIHPIREEVKWQTGNTSSPLRLYPVGPLVNEAELYASLWRIIQAYVRRYSGPEARAVIARANAERISCGPDTGAKGIIDPAFLPDIGLSPYGYWQMAFLEAGRKSPRMLASLLLVIESDSLEAQERKDRDDFLFKLRTWKQS